VGKVSAMGQPNRPTQPSIPPGLVNSNPCNYRLQWGHEKGHCMVIIIVLMTSKHFHAQMKLHNSSLCDYCGETKIVRHFL